MGIHFKEARHPPDSRACRPKEATAAKDETLRVLSGDMKANLPYVANTANSDDNQLNPVDYGVRKTKASPVTAGQARTLEALRQGEGWTFLDWKGPVNGGKVATDKAQRRERASGPWIDAGMAIESESSNAVMTAL